MEFESIKRDYTNEFVELLSESYWNNHTAIGSRITRTQLNLPPLYFRFINLRELYTGVYYDKPLESIENLIMDGRIFVNLLADYIYHNQFPSGNLRFGIKKWEEIEKLRDLLRSLDLSNEYQTMALNDYKIDEIYEKRIVLISNLTLNRRSKLNNDLRSTSTLYYDVVLPFHDRNYDENSTDCTQKQDLPMFFSYRKIIREFD